MEEEQYEALVDMFASEGWKLFIESQRQQGVAMLEAAPEKADSNDKWQYCRGEINHIRSILGFENFVTMAWEESQKEQEDVDPI